MARPSKRTIAGALAQMRAREAQTQMPACPLCDRPIPPEARASLHHLVPRLKGGANGETVRLHQICHNAIHARFSEADLADRYDAINALRADPEIAAFVAWVKTKPPAFHAGTRRARTKSGPHRGKAS